MASPVIIEYEERSRRVSIVSRETGNVLAHCLIGDDENLEKIADILSSKRLGGEAMALRKLRDDARRPLGPTGRTPRGLR